MTTSLRAADLISSIGVCAHLNDTSSSYATSDVAGQMAYLGLTNMRVTQPDANLALYQSLGRSGIRFDVISGTTNLKQQIGYLDSLAPYVALAEGPNEVNTDPVTYKGRSGAAAAQAYQADFYAAVHSDPALSGVGVLPFSLSVGGNLSGYGNVAAYADYGNVHGYASNGVPPYYMLGPSVAAVTTTPGKAPIMTETGYYTLDDKNSGVTQDVQAKWLLDTVLQNFTSGVARTYLYQLEDAYNSPTNPEDHYGLFTSAGVAKEAAYGIHNLTTILADTGAGAASFTPGALDYSVSGLSPDYGFQSVFAKSNGRFDVALWSEPQFYGSASGTAAVTPSRVTLSFSAAWTIDVYDLVLGTTPIAHYTNAYSVTLALGTDPLVIELTPASRPIALPMAASASPPPPSAATPDTAAAAVAAAGTATTVGSGSDSIVVGLSEDAYQGDAQVTFQVDGKSVGGLQTVTSLHAQGASQAFTLKGAFGAGTHQVTVTFVNDAYNPATGQDRNVYIDTIGVPAGSERVGAALYSNGGKTVQMALPQATTVLGSGADAITVNVSEDAYKGDAQVAFQVDGKAVGGAQTVTALHAAGATQAFSLHGSFGAGSHTVTVSFLNDAYGGTAATDRNLYLDNILTGSPSDPAHATLLSTGSMNFTTTLAAQPVAAPATASSSGSTLAGFDAAYYLAQNPDVAASGMDPLQHYLSVGWLEGRNPDAVFDTNYYLASNPDVKAAGLNPLVHYDAFGLKEGRDPSLLFSNSKYLAAHPELPAGTNPVAAYLQNGGTTFLSGGTEAADPLVDTSFYDRQLGATLIPTGTAGAQQAAWSYDTGGWQKGLNPDAFFDTKYYLAHNPDVAAAHINPLLHYESYGWKEGRDPSAQFSTSKYLAAYSDVRQSGMDPLLQYVQAGQAEGRTAFAV